MNTKSSSVLPEAFARGPSPRQKKFHLIYLVWLIPLVTALVAGFIAFNFIQSKGVLITITFPSATGITEGKTTVKYKDVQVGMVEKVTVSEDLEKVVVQARLDESLSDYLRAETDFWIARAKVSPQGISRLETLLTGAYIEIFPSKEGEYTTVFQGLADTPVITDHTKGRYFSLQASTLGSVDVGTPVFFRGIAVGQVMSYRLSAGELIEVSVFIEAPYDSRVNANTRFWNASGFDVRLDSQGVSLEMESFLTTLTGGIAFDTPAGMNAGISVGEGAGFLLYGSRQESLERPYAYSEHYTLLFAESLRGLSIGAPVEFRGMVVGQVLDMKLQMDVAKGEVRMPVTIEIEPERFELLNNDGSKKLVNVVETLVKMGMHAQIRTGSFLTGQAYVDLGLYPDSPGTIAASLGGHPVLPTLPSQLEDMFATAQRILAKIDRIPLDEIGTELHQTVRSVRHGANAVDLAVKDIRKALHTAEQAKILPKTGNMIDQATSALKGLESAFNSQSPVKADLEKLVRELTNTARSLRILAEYLERQPNSLVFGKEE